MYLLTPLLLALGWAVGIFAFDMSLWLNAVLVLAVGVLVYNVVRRAEERGVPAPVHVRSSPMSR